MQKTKGNPLLQARVSKEYKKRFDVVTDRLKERVPKADAPDLIRVLLGDETRFGITENERRYLSGKEEIDREDKTSDSAKLMKDDISRTLDNGYVERGSLPRSKKDKKLS